jgi:dTDP-4-amino-4,6-dideoxygalactose transaminase
VKSVPFFDYPALYSRDREGFLAVFDDVCGRGAYILQKDVDEFEQRICDLIGVKHAVSVANGTDGLIIALRSTGIEPGDEVILPAHTYVATAASVYLTGGKPVLVECGADHMIDFAAAEQAVTEKTRFLMPVHINGRTCDMDACESLAKKYDLCIVEDAAQALGSRFGDRFAGTFGLAGMFSLYPAKLLGCFGDGGVVVSNDDAVAHQMRLWRDHGRDENGEVVGWGMNSRLDNLQAAILNHKLEGYDNELRRRREIAARYEERLSDIQELTLPPGPDADQRHYDVYQNYEVEADRRDQLKSFLAEQGVGTIIQWAGKAVHQLKGLGFDQVSLPVTERMTSRFLMLPMHTALQDADVDYVCDSIRQFYGRP